MIKIAVAVPTWNRKKTLEKTLDAILSQTQSVDAVFLVDNGSTDGTEEFVKTKYKKNLVFTNTKVISDKGDRGASKTNLYYTKFTKNMGGAYGFATAMKQAYKAGYNWILTTDDDEFLLPNAIETYLKYIKKGDIIQGRRLDTKGKPLRWLRKYDFTKDTEKYLNEDEVFKENDFTKVNLANFGGMFFNRKVIEKIGYPDFDFFYQYDDKMYGVLASEKHKFKIIFIKDFTIKLSLEAQNKVFFGKNMVIESPLKLYYFTRNKFLLESKFKKLFPDKKISFLSTITKSICFQIFKIVLFCPNKINLLKTLYKAFKDRRKIGKSFKNDQN